jgi:hypothetical protein
MLTEAIKAKDVLSDIGVKQAFPIVSANTIGTAR